MPPCTGLNLPDLSHKEIDTDEDYSDHPKWTFLCPCGGRRCSLSALDVIQAQYEAGSKRIVIAKSAFIPFFPSQHGPCGRKKQKYVNYAGKIAIYGGFSGYTRKPLHDFILESNQGRDVIFVPTLQEAIDRLKR